LKGIFGGRILLLLSTQWKAVIYVFILTIIYITIHYRVSDSALEILDREERLNELKIDYTTRFSELQEMTTAGETELLLKKNKSSLELPKIPPTVVAR